MSAGYVQLTGAQPRRGAYSGAMSALGARVSQRSVPVPPESEGGILGSAYRALSFGIISVVFLIAFEATAVGTAMPVAARELDGIGLYAFAFSAYFTTSLFGMVLSGQWADRKGPLWPLAVGIAAFAAGSSSQGPPWTCGCSSSGGPCRGSGAGWSSSRCTWW